MTRITATNPPAACPKCGAKSLERDWHSWRCRACRRITFDTATPKGKS